MIGRLYVRSVGCVTRRLYDLSVVRFVGYEICLLLPSQLFGRFDIWSLALYGRSVGCSVGLECCQSVKNVPRVYCSVE